MSIRVRCPGCSASYNLAGTLAGKKIRCKKCQGVVAVPTAEAEDITEAVATDATKKTAAAKAKRQPVSVEGEEQESRPKRRRDQDKLNDAPSRKRKPSAVKRTLPLGWIIGGSVGVVLLIVGIIVIVVITSDKPDSPGQAAKGENPQKSAIDTEQVSRIPVIQLRTQFKALTVPLRTLEGPRIERIFLSADASRVAISNSGYSNKIGQVWDITGEPKKLYEQPGTIVALAPDGRRLVRWSQIGIHDIVDVDSSNILASNLRKFPWSIWIPDGASEKQQRFLNELDNNLKTQVVKNGKEVLIGEEKANRIKVLDLSTQESICEFSLAEAQPNQYWYNFTVSPDGKWIATRVGKDPFKNPFRIYSATTGAVVATPPPSTYSPSYSCAFVPDRDIFLMVSDIARPDKKGGPSLDVVAFDINQKSVVAAFRGSDRAHLMVAVSANGKVLAAGNDVGNVLIWDLTQLK